MDGGQNGIQKLLNAEEQATEIVNKARKGDNEPFYCAEASDRAQRMKDATKEAEAEISAYKNQREGEFQQYRSKVRFVPPFSYHLVLERKR